MKISKKDWSGFDGYVKPLRLMEQAFRTAGIPVVFEARDWPVHGKTVYISHPSVPKHKAICIEGGSVCQVLEDIACERRQSIDSLI
jgi:hypothetical protein